MALLVSESFDAHSTEAMMRTAGEPWSLSTTGGNITVDLGAGRNGNGLRVDHFGSGGANWATRVTFATNPTVIAGWAYKRVHSNNTASFVLESDDSSGDDVGITLGNTCTVGTGGVTRITVSGVIPVGEWCYIELWARRDNAGLLELRVNEIVVGTFSGDTRNFGAGSGYSGLTLFNAINPAPSPFTGIDHILDDLYVCNDLGGECDTYLGNIAVLYSGPDGNGTYSDWLGNDGNSTDNYLLIDEKAISDLDYIESSVTDDVDTHNHTDVTLTAPVVPAVVHKFRAARTGTAAALKTVNKLAGTELDSSSIALASSMAKKQDVRYTDANGNDWTEANINSTEFGFKKA